MRKTALLTALGCLLLCQSAHSLPSAPQEQLGDLLITLSNMQATKTVGRYTAQSGFHYLRVNVAVKNIGPKAICTFLSAGIDTSLGGGSERGYVSLTAKNGARTVLGDRIDHFLPSEEAEGYVTFFGLRDGIEPELLRIVSAGQSCAEWSPALKPITFTVTHTQGGFVIASEKPAPKEPERAVIASKPPTPPKPCAAADSPTRASAPLGVDLPDPVYTDEARRAKVEGKLQFCATVGVDGLLHDIEPLNHLGSGLDEQALSALHEWRFTPAMLDGKPVPRVILVEVSFRLHVL